jgi:hypothetical protein
VKPSIEIVRVKRKALCRLCEENIPKDTEACAFKNIWVSPKSVTLYFHKNCILTEIEKMKENNND